MKLPEWKPLELPEYTPKKNESLKKASVSQLDEEQDWYE